MDAIAELERRQALAEAQGGAERVAAQHAKGRLTARERVALLVDPGSFVELGQLGHSDRHEIGERAPADALITGVGLVRGRKVAVVAVDSTVLAGSTGRVGSRKQAQLLTLALRKGFPMVCLGDSNGGRLPDFLGSSFAGAIGDHRGEDFLGVRTQAERVPRVTAILGNAYGDPALWAALSDFVVMSHGSSVGLSGPPLVGAAIGEKVSHEHLAGLEVVAKQNGVVSRVEPTESQSIEAVKTFLDFLPSHSGLLPSLVEAKPPSLDPKLLPDIVPDRLSRAYDMHRVIGSVVDRDSFFELHGAFGRSLITGLARLEGRAVGILANQPKHQAGVLDPASLIKATKLVDVCDTFNLPLIFLQDLPGVMIGSAAERSGVAVRLMELFQRLENATTPKITVILRKAFGFGWVVMGGTPIGVDYICAWPNAQIGFMDATNASHVLYRKQIADEEFKNGREAALALSEKYMAEIERENEPWQAAGLAHIHNIIRPENTRNALLDGLFLAEGYRNQKSSRNR